MGGSGNKHDHLNLHLHIPHFNFHHQIHNHDKKHDQDVPKGCISIMVGHEGDEELQKFVIPVIYINHPLFMELLKAAEDEYGFDQKGPITLPCYVDEFRTVQGLIDRDNNMVHHHHHHHHHHIWCFRAWSWWWWWFN